MIDGSHPLWNAWLKWHWARKHLVALEREARRYDDNETYTSVLQVDGEWTDSNDLRLMPGMSHDEVVIHSKFDKPQHVALMLGDMLANLRSCLDYIAWEVSHKNGRGAHTQFPIVDHNPYMNTGSRPDRRVEAITSWQKQTGNMNFAARWMVMACQPYRARNGGGESLLSDLRDLLNADKHRTLTGIIVDLPSGQNPSLECYRDDGTTLSIAEMNRYRIVIPHYERTSKFSVAVNNRAPYPVTLRLMCENVGSPKVVMADTAKGPIASEEKALDIFNAVTVILMAFIERWDEVRPSNQIGGKRSRIAKRHQAPLR